MGAKLISKNGVKLRVGHVVEVPEQEICEWSGVLKGVVVATYKSTVMVCSGNAEGYYEVPANEIEVIIPTCGYGRFLFDPLFLEKL